MTTVADSALLGSAAVILGHPMGNRRSDPQLAAAAVRGHLGRRPHDPGLSADGTLAEGLRAWQPGFLRRQVDALRQATIGPRTSRRWYLRRAEQRDQGASPMCMAYTQKHWELSVPTINRRGLPEAEMYARCKAIDRWPGEDGTSADAMLTVCRELGIVASHWWWTGPQDDDAARRWLLDIGPLMFGAGWAESMFRPDDAGLVTVEGPLLYGHEVLVIGRTPNFRRLGPALEIVNSWGLANFGVLGRAWILERDFFGRLMPEGGDLVGIIEQRR